MPTTPPPRSRVPLSPEALAFREDFAATLRAARAAKKMTLAQVAALMPGTTAPDFDKIEKGLVNCSIEKARQACDALDIDIVFKPRKRTRS